MTFNGSNQTITGTTTFYDLTNTESSPDTLSFGTSTKIITDGMLTLTGQVGNLLSLRSTASGTPWYVDSNGDYSINYIDVQDSFNVSGSAIEVYNTNIDSGNNSNWQFIAPPYNTRLKGNIQLNGGMRLQ